MCSLALSHTLIRVLLKQNKSDIKLLKRRENYKNYYTKLLIKNLYILKTFRKRKIVEMNLLI